MAEAPKYQLLSRLSDEEYAALEADIRKRGVMVPVERDEAGEILDGHNRHEIAARLGLPCPEIVRRFGSEREKREHVIKMNLARRHLDPLRWGQAFRLLLEERGVESGQGSSAAKRHSQSATVADIAAELGVPERTARHRLEQAKVYESLPEPVRERVDGGELTLPQAKAEVKRIEKREELKAKAEAAPRARLRPWKVVVGDCVEELARLDAGCARLVFADPPYNVGVDYGDGADADLLPGDRFVRWLSEWVAASRRVLAGDGSLWALISDEYAAECCVEIKRAGFTVRNWVKWYEGFGVNCSGKFNRCTRHLFHAVKGAGRFVFHEDAVSRPSDRQTRYNDARANPSGKLLDDCWFDVPRLAGTHNERLPDFPTQLPIALLSRVVACASDPGDLVIDPFSGSGTTGVAAVRLGRRYLGIERRPRFAELSTLRLKGETP